MALPGFVEEAWQQPRVSALRVVLTPSFHSEVCITLVEEAGDISLAVRAFDQQFWVHGVPRSVQPFHAGDCAFGYGLFQETLALFDQARIEAKKPRGICLDGMGMHACLVTDGAEQTFDINAGSGGAPAELVRKLIDWSWTLIEDPRVRNALAHCATYVGREYTIKKLPARPAPKPVTRLAILGAADERAEYLQKLQKVLSGQGSAAPAR